ncbi:MAG: YggS family pyridoxal phosphate-dependent enzyme [Pseudonocardiaceae bacterium]
MTSPFRSAGSPSPAEHRPDPVAGLDAVRRVIVQACARAGREPWSVTLVAACKTVPAELVERAIEADHGVYGENRVQEARAKWPALRERHPDVRLHLLGPLQSNKVRDAVAVFDAIHSVDRPTLCRALARACGERGCQPELFVQVNTGAEAQKAGVAVTEVDGFLAGCRDTYDLEIGGLMCVPPAGEPPAPHFTLLAEIAARHGLSHLSMGMSTDFATAIACGATHVRVGSAIFGSRPPTAQGSAE